MREFTADELEKLKEYVTEVWEEAKNRQLVSMIDYMELCHCEKIKRKLLEKSVLDKTDMVWLKVMMTDHMIRLKNRDADNNIDKELRSAYTKIVALLKNGEKSITISCG